MKKILYFLFSLSIITSAKDLDNVNDLCTTTMYPGGSTLMECYDARLYNNLVDTTTVFISINAHSAEYSSVCAIGKYARAGVNRKMRIKLYRSNGTLRFNGNTWTSGCKFQPNGKVDLSELVFYEGYCVTKSSNEGKFVNDPSKCK